MRRSRLLPKLAAAPADDRTPLAVLEFQSPTAAVIATPVPWIAASTNYVITALVLSLLLVAVFMRVDQIVTAHGELVSTSPDFSIQAFNATSIVQSIDVHPGELVTKGQVLARLNPTYAAADLSSLTEQEQGYAAQVAQLQAQEDGKPYVPDPSNPASALQLQTYVQQTGQYNYTVQNYTAQIAQLRTQIAGYEAQAAYYTQRLKIASNVESMRKDLQNLQVGSKLDTLAATDDRVNIQAELASAISQAAADEKQLASVEAQRDSFEDQYKANTSQLLSQAIVNLAQARQQLAKAKLDDQLVELTAPQEAIVQSIAPVADGSVLQAGQELMQLAPVNAPLTVEADIDGDQSGYVRVGDTVVIKFDTLPFLRFGSAKGVVTSISPESFNPQDQQQQQASAAPLPGAPQDLYYKAEISVDEIELHNTPAGFKLVPGMPVEADMKVGTRTVMGYFTQRLLPVAYNSLHEP